MSAVREPKISRESTSRPKESVPSQCASDGRASIAPKSTASGSYGASTGASRATANMTTMTAAPTAPSVRARQNSRAAASQRASAPGGAASTASGTGTRAMAMGCWQVRGAPRLRRGASERWGVWGAISGPPTTIDERAADPQRGAPPRRQPVALAPGGPVLQLDVEAPLELAPLVAVVLPPRVAAAPAL